MRRWGRRRIGKVGSSQRGEGEVSGVPEEFEDEVEEEKELEVEERKDVQEEDASVDGGEGGEV